MRRNPIGRYSRLSVLAGLAGLAGCALQPYAPPGSGATAKLQIRSQIDAGVVLVSTFDDALACTGRKIIASRGLRGVAVANTDTRLAANQPVTLWLHHTNANSRAYCNVQFTFKPKPDHVYMIRPRADDKYCYMPLLDVTNPAEARPDNTIVKRTFTQPAFATGPSCARMAVQPVSTSDVASASIESGAAPKASTSSTGLGKGSSLDDFNDLLPTK